MERQQESEHSKAEQTNRRAGQARLCHYSQQCAGADSTTIRSDSLFERGYQREQGEPEDESDQRGARQDDGECRQDEQG